jgi:tetratricopeptide (TPR) repeat protein
LLDGRRIALFGKLAGMSRRDAEQLVRDRGGLVVADVDAGTELIVVGDDTPDFGRMVAGPHWLNDAARLAWREGRLQLVRESEFWARLGLVDAGPGVRRLYTPAMLAELVRVPVRAIRHWQRKGHLCTTHQVGRLPYFDFEEVRIARRLAELVAAGCSLSHIDRKLDELARLLPNVERPLADAAVVVAGGRLCVRRGDTLTEPSGQVLIDFDASSDSSGECRAAAEAATIPITAASLHGGRGSWSPAALASYDLDDLRSLADDFEESGEPERAIEVYRAILMSGQFTAEDHFCLAESLYRSGDLAAARERYYAAIEMDEDYVEARANLGCMLTEQGEHALAEAAFRGALEYHPEFADAHYHLARLLDSLNRPLEASQHWTRFLELAPASPWAEEALDRVGGKLSS